MVTETRGCGWRHAPEAWAEIWEKELVEFLPPNEGVEIQSWARPDDFVRYGRRSLVGLRADDVKAVSIERLCLFLSLSLLMSKTFKLKKVNKSFVPEPISCFRIPIYVYEHFMNIMSISCSRLHAASPGGNTPQDTNCTATCPLSRKLFKLDEPDMQDTAGEAGTSS